MFETARATARKTPKAGGSPSISFVSVLPSRTLPLCIALTYGALGSLWILLADYLEGYPQDNFFIRTFRDDTGWLFICLTSCLLFVLLDWVYMRIRRNEKEALDNVKRLDRALMAAGGGVWERDLKSGDMLYISSKLREVTGIDMDSPEEFSGAVWRERIHPDDWPRVRESTRRLFQHPDEEQSIHYRVKDAKGEYRWFASHGRVISDNEGKLTRSAGIILDINSSMEANARIQQLLYYDELTGLPNRRLLTQNLEALINENAATDQILIAQIDIDNFKGLNGEFGSEFADRTLSRTAERLQKTVGSKGFVARSGADEFIVVLKGIAGDSETQDLVRWIRDCVIEPMEIAGQRFELSISGGVTVHPADGQNASQLLSRAEVALTKARRSGGNQLQFYEHGMNEAYRHRTMLATELRHAIAEQKLEIHYQPIFRADDLGLQGFEALARWTCPGFGPISPAVFIPLAEEIGLIGVMSRALMRLACAEAARWNDGRATSLRLSFNVSPIQLATGDFVAEVVSILEETGLRPDCLVLEITESTLMENTRIAHDRLGRLKDMGIGVAIDDFGTGYSSLALLRKLPVTKLKIDRSFIRDLDATPEAATVVTTVLELARALDLAVTAEGIENEQQLAFLRERGCTFLQGFHLGMPMPAREARELLSAGPRLAAIA